MERKRDIQVHDIADIARRETAPSHHIARMDIN